MLPKIDLVTFFLSISQATVQALQSTPLDLKLARHNIDLLELMQEKTKNNRTPEEDQLLEHLLYQLRMSFVQASQKNA